MKKYIQTTLKLSALVGAISIAAAAFAQSSNDYPDLSKGTQEFGIFGNVDWSHDISYDLDITYAWFVKDDWEVGAETGISGVESDANFSLGVFTEYNWTGQSKWTPFVGASLYWASLEDDLFDASSIAMGVDVGVKYFIRSNVAISLSVGADYAAEDVFPGGDDFNSSLDIGTRFYF